MEPDRLMTDGIIQETIKKHLSLYDAPEKESIKLMYYLKPFCNDLEQELIENIKQESEYHGGITYVTLSKLIGDNK